MPTEIIKAFLAQDYTDVSPQTIYTNNPTVYTSSADVDVWVYQSLATLLQVSSGNLSARIVEAYGQGIERTDAHIVIQQSRVEESITSLLSYKSDQIGAEYADVQITAYNAALATSPDLVRNIQLRIRYLIDHSVRQLRGKSPYISISGDTSILNQYFGCMWIWQGSLITSEFATGYRVDYVRRFPTLVPTAFP